MLTISPVLFFWSVITFVTLENNHRVKLWYLSVSRVPTGYIVSDKTHRFRSHVCVYFVTHTQSVTHVNAIRAQRVFRRNLLRGTRAPPGADEIGDEKQKDIIDRDECRVLLSFWIDRPRTTFGSRKSLIARDVPTRKREGNKNRRPRPADRETFRNARWYDKTERARQTTVAWTKEKPVRLRPSSSSCRRRPPSAGTQGTALAADGPRGRWP